MQKEFYLREMKKDSYPTKSVINLYYKEDKTTRPSTIALYVLFLAVVCLALTKLFIYDRLAELNAAKAELQRNQSYLAGQMKELGDYREVSELYGRYTYSYLQEDENICDRLEVLAMLEKTVFAKANIQNLVITGNVVSLNFSGLNLEETAQLVQEMNGYEVVERVDVNTATSDDTSRMVITLAAPKEGGAQK